jgi:hypothetical protein
MLATSSKSSQILNQSKDSMKNDLDELCSDRLLAHLTANPSKLKYGREMLHGDLQRLYYNMGGIHILNLKIKEDIEF